MFKHLISTSKKTLRFSFTNIKWFREIIAVYSENRKKLTSTLCGQNAELLNVKASGTYNNHCSDVAVRYNNALTTRWKQKANLGL
jgi:hypothetical protein